MFWFPFSWDPIPHFQEILSAKQDNFTHRHFVFDINDIGIFQAGTDKGNNVGDILENLYVFSKSQMTTERWKGK